MKKALYITIPLLLIIAFAVYCLMGSDKDKEHEQMFSATREYIETVSVEGMEVDLEILKELDKWALLEATPITVETDKALVVLEKEGDLWTVRDFGTLLEGWEERLPELFK
jgi:hypothetical protein